MKLWATDIVATTGHTICNIHAAKLDCSSIAETRLWLVISSACGWIVVCGVLKSTCTHEIRIQQMPCNRMLHAYPAHMIACDCGMAKK